MGQDLRDLIERGGMEIRHRTELVTFLESHPNAARPEDVTFLARRVRTLEAYIEFLELAGAIRPRHEWLEFDHEIDEQMRKCIDTWEQNK